MAEYLQQIRRLSAWIYVLTPVLVAALVWTSGAARNHGVEVFSLLVIAFATGVFVHWFPWYRHHSNWFLSVGLTASLMIGLLVYWTGGVASAFFPLFFFVVVASGAYYTTRPMILVTGVACLAAASYLLYSGPLTTALMLPALVFVPTLVAVAVICNVIFLGLQRSVESAELRAKFIAALHDVDLTILSDGSVEPSLKVATEHLKEILGCDRAITTLWTDDGLPDLSAPCGRPERDVKKLGKAGSTVTIPLTVRDHKLGELRLSWASGKGAKKKVETELEKLAHGFATQLAVIVQTAHLSQQAEEARRLRELNRLQDEFISMVSHDLRTPLTSIIGYSELLRRKRISPDVEASSVERIHRSALDLARMVDELLDMSRLNAGRLELTVETHDINLLVTRAVEAASVLSERHRLDVEVPDGPLFATVDDLRFSEVLNNLIGNAIRYSPDGGSVTIRVRGDDDSVRITVADEGVGIARDELARIFERFYRGSNVKDAMPGTGLGLAICRGIIQAHGGRIWVESPGRGRGSQFTFVIPRFSRENPRMVGAGQEKMIQRDV